MPRNKIKTPEDAIALMKGKGIRFDITTEEEAKRILKERNYYYKLMAYCDNYEKGQRGAKKGRYLSLDFAHLKELAVIDMHLRYLLLLMCLDIEHHIKLRFIHDIEQNPAEDGKSIVNAFDPKFVVREKVLRQAVDSYTYDRIQKYRQNMDFSIWVLCEFITFGELCRLYHLYVTKYPGRSLPKYSLLNAIKNMRNNCAHSNCLISKLYKPSRRYKVTDIINDISRIPSISKSSRKKYLSVVPIHDFAVVLYYYANFVQSRGLIHKRKTELYTLFLKRIREKRYLFKSNDGLVGSYLFCVKLITYFFKNY